MHYLIEQLLNTHQRYYAQGSMVYRNVQLDLQAAIFYREAQAEHNRRLSGKKKNPTHALRILKDIVACRLTQALQPTELNPETYESLVKAVKRWRPETGRAQNACLNIQQILLALLPSVRQKQHLQKIGHEYQQYLTTEIEQHLQTHHPQAYTQAVHSRTTLFGAPPVYTRNMERKVEDRRRPIARIAEKPSQYLTNPNPTLEIALNKYQAVDSLLTTLKTPVKAANHQLEDFRREFAAQRRILEKNRDSMAMKFLKGVTTALTLGLAWVCGIWNVKGEAVSQSIQKTLQISEKPARLAKPACH